jgi:uncharacterized protein involved in response to NO
MSLLAIEEPETSREYALWQTSHPVWRCGFRPFYLLAAGFAAIAVPLWIARYFGWLAGWQQVGLNWHMHEMVFGMVLAVIIGFLYTAGRNWTGLWTPRSGYLAALAGLWLAGRMAMLMAPPIIGAMVDLLFLPLAAWPLYQVLRQSGNKRNLFLVALLGMLMLANIIFHAAALGWINTPTTSPIQAAILIIVVIVSVIGARVIPMFTSNGAPGSNPIVHAKRDRITLVLTLAASLAWVGGLPAPLVAALTFATACAVLVRVAGWMPQRTIHVPLLWILHLSYGWIAIGFFLLALAALNMVPASAAFHALTVGSVAGMILGMITRTALGHTGRMLKAGYAETVMYSLIQLGAIARVWAAIGAAGMGNALLIVAAVCWSIAFLLYVITYGPYLIKPRIDGREG